MYNNLSKLLGIETLLVFLCIIHVQASEAQQIFENPYPSIISLDDYFNGTKDSEKKFIENTLPFTETMTKKKMNNFQIPSDDLNSEITRETKTTEKISSQSHVLTLGRVDLTKETTFSFASKNIEDIVEKTIYSSKSSIIGNFINLGVGNGYEEKPNITPFGVWTFDCQNNVDYENDPDTSTHASFSISSNDPDDGKISFNYTFPKFTSTGEVDQGIVVIVEGVGDDDGEYCRATIEKIESMYVPTLAKESTGIDYNLDEFDNIISKDTHHFFKEEIHPLYEEQVFYEEDLTWDLKIPPGDRAPRVSAMAIPNPVKPGEPFTLDGSGSSDPDEGDSIVGYKWERAVPPGGIVGSSPTVELIAPEVDEETTYTYFLYANDTHDVVGKGGVNVIIKPENTPPDAVADAYPNPVKPGEPFTLDGSGSSDPDEGDSIVSYEWHQLDQPAGIISHSRSPTLQLTAPDVDEETTLTYGLIVEDTHQAKTGAVISVIVLPNNPPIAVATASPNPAIPGQVITLDGSSSLDPDLEDQISTYVWELQSPGGATIGNSPIVQFTAPNVDQDTTYRFQLTVSDTHNAISITTVDVLIQACSENTLTAQQNNQCRNPIAIATASPNPAIQDEKVTLDGSLSRDPDPNGGIISYLWKSSDHRIVLSNPTDAITTFIVPKESCQTVPEPLEFSLEVVDKSLKSSTTNVKVDIKKWTKQQYVEKALEKICFDPDTIPNDDDYWIDLNQAITGRYAKLHLDNRDTFKWAGMAAYASNLVGTGLTWADKFGDKLPVTPNVDEDKLFVALRDGNVELYKEIGWQHEAYMCEGIDGLERISEEGDLPVQLLNDWQQISQGQIWPGNTDLLSYEQNVFFQTIVYNPYRELWKAVTDSTLIPIMSPIPTDSMDFVKYMKKNHPLIDPDIGDSNQRWSWITNSMLPAYQTLSIDKPSKVGLDLTKLAHSGSLICPKVLNSD